jgi:hypothetical protein
MILPFIKLETKIRSSSPATKIIKSFFLLNIHKCFQIFVKFFVTESVFIRLKK